MDFPLKFELPKFSHSHLLSTFLPVIPGTAVCLSQALLGISLVESAMGRGLGYRTAIVACLATTYIIGLTSMHVIDGLSSLLFRIIRPFNHLPISADPYWQQLVLAYLGPDLCPKKSDGEDALETVELAVRSRIASKEARNQISESKKRLDEVEANIARLLEKASHPGITGRDSLQAELASLRERAREMQAKRSKRLAEAVHAYRWSQLHIALSYAAEAKAPNENYDLLMLALQAGAAILLTMLIWYRSFYHRGVLVFTALVLATTIYTRWNIYRINNSFVWFNVAPISSLLKLLRPQKEIPESLEPGSGPAH